MTLVDGTFSLFLNYCTYYVEIMGGIILEGGELACEHRIYEPMSLEVYIIDSFYGYKCLCYRYSCYKLFPFYSIPICYRYICINTFK